MIPKRVVKRQIVVRCVCAEFLANLIEKRDRAVNLALEEMVEPEFLANLIEKRDRAFEIALGNFKTEA